jgi:hypothetical protein
VSLGSDHNTMPSKPTTKPSTYSNNAIDGIPLIQSADNISIQTTFTAEMFSFLVQIKKKIGSKYEQDAIRFCVQQLMNKTNV